MTPVVRTKRSIQYNLINKSSSSFLTPNNIHVTGDNFTKQEKTIFTKPKTPELVSVVPVHRKDRFCHLTMLIYSACLLSLGSNTSINGHNKTTSWNQGTILYQKCLLSVQLPSKENTDWTEWHIQKTNRFEKNLPPSI